MVISIIRAGAMGYRFGMVFAEAGTQVRLYDIWQEHVNQVNANGLVVEDGVGGERTLGVNAASDISRILVSDMVVIFTESMYTMDVITKAVPVIDRGTVVLTLQNGLGNIEAVKEATGSNPVTAGVTNYASDLLKLGWAELKGSGATEMTALDEGTRGRAVRLVGLLCAVEHNAMFPDDVFTDIREKVAFNAALDMTTVITGLMVGGVGSLSESRQLLFDISSEVVMVAKAEGISASESHVHGIIESVFNPEMSGDHKTSMLQDRILKWSTEVEAVYGRVVQTGKKHGFKAPKLECTYALVRVIECNYNKICL